MSVESPVVTLEELRRFTADQLPFCAEMNIGVEAVSLGEATARFGYDDRWTRPVDFIAGPVLMALADAAMYWAILATVGIVPLAVTNELKMNFLRPAIGGDVLATARILKLGRRIAYGTADVYMGGAPERLVAHATTSYIMPEGWRITDV
jgi:uncharacterized protein (TIGR00369 family)